MVQGMDAPRAHFPRECRQHFVRASPAKHEARAGGAQIACEAGEAPMQPPAGGRPHASMARRLVVHHIDRHDRPFRAGREQGSLIAQPQVAAQPEDDRFRHRGALPQGLGGNPDHEAVANRDPVEALVAQDQIAIGLAPCERHA